MILFRKIERQVWSITSSRLQRKRKNFYRSRRAPKRAVPSSSSQDEVPRAPCDLTEAQLSFQNCWTLQGRQQLDACLHPVDDDETVEPRSFLLGVLQDLGHYHFQLQSKVDDKPVTSALTTKQRLRLQRSAKSERLGDHKPEEREDEVRRVSRVSATTDTLNKSNWLDLHFSHCLLEYVADTGDGVRRRELLAFSSIEAMLLDENE
jgi:hypothetical protein